MIPIKRDMTLEEQKRYRREDYELQKEGLIAFFREQKYDEKNLNIFLVSSLKKWGFEQELEEDGLL